MKKVFAITLASVVLLAGCSSKSDSDETTKKHKVKETVEATETTEATPTPVKVKVVKPEDIPSYDELLANKGTMITATFIEGGEVSSADGYIISAEYVVDYNGTLTITAEFNLSGTITKEFTLTEEEYTNCYLWGANGIYHIDKPSNYGEGDDESTYTYSFTNINGGSYEFYIGYYNYGDINFQFMKLMNQYTTLM